MMKSQLRFALALFVAALGLASAQSTHGVDIYVLSNNQATGGSPSTDFGTINSVTGAYTSIASLSGEIWNLAWNPAADNFFVSEGVSGSSTLRTLSKTGSLSASIGTVGVTVYAMAYRTVDSTLYAWDYDSDETGTINTSNGSWTVLNSNPGGFASSPAGGRYTILNDTMYATAEIVNSGLGTIGYTSTSTFQQIKTDSLYFEMILANDGTNLYGIFGDGTAGNQKLYSINPATGVLTAGPVITGTGLGTYFHGAGIVPVPEPSTYALGTLAAGTIACIARRRKTNRARA